MNKCTKTMTGKHKFYDPSYTWVYNPYVPSMLTDMFTPEMCKPLEFKIKRPITCEYCGTIDDRKNNGTK